MEKTLVRQYVGRAVIIIKDKVLLVNKIGEPHYFLPGGRLEEGESLRDCVRREIKEELNAQANIGQFIGCIEHAFEIDNKPYYEVGFFFEVDVPGLSVNDDISNEDDLQFKWVKIADVDELDVRPQPVKELLKQLVKGNRYTGYWATTVERR